MNIEAENISIIEQTVGGAGADYAENDEILKAISVQSSPMINQVSVYGNQMRSRKPTGNLNSSQLSGWTVKTPNDASLASNKDIEETLMIQKKGKMRSRHTT